jgi:hypothetical protein
MSLWVFMTYSGENFTFFTFVTEENGKNQDSLQTGTVLVTPRQMVALHKAFGEIKWSFNAKYDGVFT